VLRSLFNRSQTEPGRQSRTVLSGPRIPRHSSGWTALLKHLKEELGLRVLDIGPTSPQNINFLTGLGQSVYMADVVHESLSGEYDLTSEDGTAAFNVEKFFEHNLNFSGRQFDVVMLWATLDYIPEGLVTPLIEHLYTALTPGGRVLAIFHTKLRGPETAFCRYHLTDGNEIEMQESEPFLVERVYTNRNIEKLFAKFSNYRFFLAKDNLYEVIITR
jgi:SAM-dependent methyltransferase